MELQLSYNVSKRPAKRYLLTALHLFRFWVIWPKALHIPWMNSRGHTPAASGNRTGTSFCTSRRITSVQQHTDITTKFECAWVPQVPGRERAGGGRGDVQPQGDWLQCNAERGCLADALLGLQPVPAQHVPVPDGQADHGHALAGVSACGECPEAHTCSIHSGLKFVCASWDALSEHACQLHHVKSPAITQGLRFLPPHRPDHFIA